VVLCRHPVDSRWGAAWFSSAMCVCVFVVWCCCRNWARPEVGRALRAWLEERPSPTAVQSQAAAQGRQQLQLLVGCTSSSSSAPGTPGSVHGSKLNVFGSSGDVAGEQQQVTPDGQSGGLAIVGRSSSVNGTSSSSGSTAAVGPAAGGTVSGLLGPSPARGRASSLGAASTVAGTAPVLAAVAAAACCPSSAVSAAAAATLWGAQWGLWLQQGVRRCHLVLGMAMRGWPWVQHGAAQAVQQAVRRPSARAAWWMQIPQVGPAAVPATASPATCSMLEGVLQPALLVVSAAELC